MPFNPRARLFKAFPPNIEPPEIYHFDGLPIPPADTESVLVEILQAPEMQAVDVLRRPSVVRKKVGISRPAVVDVLDVFGDDARLFDGIEILSLFKPLVRPDVVGKNYRERQPKRISGETQVGRGVPSGGKKRRRRSIPPKPEVADVFEELRLILQPPILPPDGIPVIFPNGMRPYPFQIAGVKWLTEHKRALLADEMGLGKTIQAIIAMRLLFRNGELQKTLVVCPASMTGVWEREVKSWAPELRPVRIQGAKWVRESAWSSPAQIYIVSYETLRNDIFDNNIPDFAPSKFDLYVLDEVQKIKNPKTKNHRAIKRLNPSYRWALTGTPIENSVEDVVNIFDVIKPNLFPFGDFIDARDVRRKIQDYVLRRTIDEVNLDMPDLTRQNHWLDLTPRQRDAYEAAESHGVAEIESQGEDATRMHILKLITRLKQICNYEEASGQSCKLDFLIDELESLKDAGDDKALVFSQYPNKTLAQIEPKLKLRKFAPLTYEGSMPARKRDEVVRRFQESDDNMALLMSVRAGGVGLTLTRANHVFHFDHWWNPAVVDQASARVRRIGQKKPVFVHSLYAADTIEERIFNLLQEKRAASQAVFGKDAQAIDKNLERLSDEDLYGLFDLNVPNKAGQSGGRSPSNRNRVGKSFYDMSPVEFEEAVCDLFQGLGYNLSVTKQSGDGGIDLDGHRNGLGGGRVVVQCKRYKDNVGEPVVRDLLGVMASDNSIERGFVVTTGKFTRQAIDFAAGERITLIDGAELQMRHANIARNDSRKR